MHEDTLKALQASIEHHRALLREDPIHHFGTEQCALCHRFRWGWCTRRDKMGTVLERCPVSIRTGQTGCDGSPYEAALRRSTEKRCAQIGACPELLSAARAAFQAAERQMIDFLVSLLPPGQEGA